MIPHVPPEAEAALDWLALTDALAEGHLRPRARLGDTLLRRGDDALLSRAAWIDGLGMLVKTASVFPGVSPSVNGAVTVFSDETGAAEATLDFHLVTKWKTAGDSLLAARRLAPPGAERIAIVGAGAVARSLREAYGAAFPGARFEVWNRSGDKALALAADYPDTEAAGDLEAMVRGAQIVTVATMATAPVVMGEWLSPGSHLDLIGAYAPHMREADDLALTRGSVFLDSRETVLGHIGELDDPIRRGVLQASDIKADLYEPERFRRRSGEEITVFKNGGGAHLDLMTARYVMAAWAAAGGG